MPERRHMPDHVVAEVRDNPLVAVLLTTEAMSDLAAEVLELRATLAAIKAADPDLFDPTGGFDRGAAYETYGSAGEDLREKYCAAIGTPLTDADAAR